MEHSTTQPQSSNIFKKIITWLTVDKVFLVSLIIAIISVSLGGFTTKFFNYKVIAVVFGMMLVISGFRSTGLLNYLGQSIINRSKSVRQLVRFTILLTFFLAVFFTNDLTILTIMPLYLAITREIKNRKSVYIGAAMIVPACHMGSTLLPQGNPHNLYLYTFYQNPVHHLGHLLTNAEFFSGTSLMWLAGLICLMIATQFISNDPITVETKVQKFNKGEVALFIALMILMGFAVFGYINFYLAAGIVAVFALAFSLKTKKNLFKGVDYHLLFTFAFFFFIIGNIARIPEVINFIQSTFVGPQMAFLGTVITSQFLSNIAAPILISPFTPHAVAVTLGADVGGVGTMVASMATLIAYKIIRVQARGETAGFIKYFAIVNAAFLVVLATIGVVIVSFITF